MTPQKLSGNLNRKLIAFPEKKKYYTLRKNVPEMLSGKKGRPKWLHSSYRVIHMNCQSPCRCSKRDRFVWKNSTGSKGQVIRPDRPLCRQYQIFCQTAACFGFFRNRRFYVLTEIMDGSSKRKDARCIAGKCLLETGPDR